MMPTGSPRKEGYIKLEFEGTNKRRTPDKKQGDWAKSEGVMIKVG